ncbi:enoyl-CoA hydratase [Desulfocicer vacuolatum DSM 3385]|uniref:Enoyl-CoA hydratase n=1 Tax=Desulfocicer vacuolatum DSM 3385 TaxID=1121400 RepID=A0A1W1ZTG2_9BACT|nr:enoyl-CoA hydratase/isomerase family protein [Desulfocicer vacuolatum]SMC51552.1 enoyl-CoA hydratase [Desulfocicer vacuolatum DSM 3385]
MLETRIEDNILIGTLTGDKTSAMDRETLEHLQEAVDRTERDDDIKGMILTGQNRFFSTGFNLNSFIGFETLEQAGNFIAFADQVFLNIFKCPKPVVCAMNGHAVAGGLILSMAADYRILSNHPKTKVGMSEINIGVPLSAVQTNIMKFGLDSDRVYRNLMYFGKLINSEDALAQHVVDEILDPATLMERAKKIVSSWMNTPGTPFIRLKQELKREATALLEKRVSEKERYQKLDFFLNKEVKASMARVQASMA